MNDLTIKQNTQIKETNVPASTITKLVQLSKSGTNMELVGWIGILGGIKKSEKDYMDQHYGNNGELLEWLTIDAPKIYLDFEDPAVETIMMSVASSDGIGITVEDAAALLNNLFPSFADNTTVTSFNELKEFTNITLINFRNCSNLAHIDLTNIRNLGFLAFSNNTSLTGVLNLPNFVSFTDRHAFNNCSSLTEVNFGPSLNPEGLMTGMFLGCSNLVRVTGLNNVTKIYGEMFARCLNLEYIDLDFSKITSTSIEDRIFQNCKKLFTNLDLSQTNFTEIGNECFYGCTSLLSITLPNTLTTIANECFYGCTSLLSITLPNTLTTIGNATFGACTNLTSITIPSSVTSLSSAFQGCTGLLSVTLLGNFTKIMELCFMNCTSLTSLTIPESVTEIQNQAFGNCTSLTSLILPTTNSLTIKELCFSECRSLTSLTLPSNCRGYELWQLPTGMLSLSLNISTTTCALQQLNINTTNFDVLWFSNSNFPLLELTVPDCCLYLDCSSITLKKLIFSQNSNLKGFCSMNLIKNYDSYDWDNFTSSDKGKIPDGNLSNVQDIVNIPALKVIPRYFFDRSTKSYLTSNFINNAISNAVVIGMRAFQNMNPTSTIGDITIPSTVKFIGSSAFYDAYHKITSLTFQSITPPEVEDMNFYDWGYGNSRFGGQKIYVPDAAVSDYQTAWTDYSSIIYPISNKSLS